MKSKKLKKNKGFGATIAVVLMSSGIIVFAFSVMLYAFSFSDMVYKKEMRIQTSLDLKSCLDMLTLMVVKDYFMSGITALSDFLCIATVENDYLGNITINATSSNHGVIYSGKKYLKI